MPLRGKSVRAAAGQQTRRQAPGRLQAEPAEHRIIATHDGTASWVVAAWMGIPAVACAYVSFRVPAGSVTVLEEDDRFHNRALTVLGDRSPHLAERLSDVPAQPR